MHWPELLYIALSLLVGLALGRYCYMHFGPMAAIPGGMVGLFLPALCVLIYLKVADQRRARKRAK